MDVRPYVTKVQEQLAATADLGDETTQRTAAKLTTAAEPALRLALLSAISALVDDITVALLDVPGAPALSVRLAGEDIEVEIRPAAAEPDPAPSLVDDEDNTARISLRLPEALKTQVDEAARRQGVSVNTWLVREVGRALAPTARYGGGGQHLTGWING
jgi:hypothetical protein